MSFGGRHLLKVARVMANFETEFFCSNSLRTLCECGERAEEPPVREALKAATDHLRVDLDSACSKSVPNPLLPLRPSVQILFEPSVNG
jgi:hypothetical protein